MADIINFPNSNKTPVSQANSVNMTLTRNYKGLTISINLAKLSKEELIQALMPLPSEAKAAKSDFKIELVKKYINQ